MNITRCRLWKLTLVVLVMAAIVLIIAASVLSKTAKDHNNCPAMDADCPICKVCVLNEPNSISSKTNIDQMSIQPISDNKFLGTSEDSKKLILIDEETVTFSYDEQTKNIIASDGRIIYYQYLDDEPNLVFLAEKNDYSLPRWDKIRSEWYLSPDNGRIITFTNIKEKTYSLAVQHKNELVLQENTLNMFTHNILFEISFLNK